VGTRVPVRNLIDYLEAGDSLEEFLRSFPSVSRQQAVAALELAGELLTASARSLFDQMRRQVAPFAEAQGMLTDEDVFKVVS
jgi:hypothetical protein